MGLAEPRLGEGLLAEPRLSEGLLTEPRLSEGLLTEPRLSEGLLAKPRLGERLLAKPRLSEGLLAKPRLSEPATTCGGTIPLLDATNGPAGLFSHIAVRVESGSLRQSGEGIGRTMTGQILSGIFALTGSATPQQCLDQRGLAIGAASAGRWAYG